MTTVGNYLTMCFQFSVFLQQSLSSYMYKTENNGNNVMETECHCEYYSHSIPITLIPIPVPLPFWATVLFLFPRGIPMAFHSGGFTNVETLFDTNLAQVPLLLTSFLFHLSRCPSMGVAMNSDARKMSRKTRKCFSECAAPKFVEILSNRCSFEPWTSLNPAAVGIRVFRSIPLHTSSLVLSFFVLVLFDDVVGLSDVGRRR